MKVSLIYMYMHVKSKRPILLLQQDKSIKSKVHLRYINIYISVLMISSMYIFSQTRKIQLYDHEHQQDVTAVKLIKLWLLFYSQSGTGDRSQCSTHRTMQRVPGDHYNGMVCPLKGGGRKAESLTIGTLYHQGV